MTILLERASRQYNAGADTLGPVAVPLGLQLVRLSFTREAWPDVQALLVMRIEIGFDGGATWPDFAQSQWNGGARVNRLGQTVTQEVLQFDLHQPQNPQRMARFIATRAQALRTALTLEAF